MKILTIVAYQFNIHVSTDWTDIMSTRFLHFNSILFYFIFVCFINFFRVYSHSDQIVKMHFSFSFSFHNYHLSYNCWLNFFTFLFVVIYLICSLTAKQILFLIAFSYQFIFESTNIITQYYLLFVCLLCYF